MTPISSLTQTLQPDRRFCIAPMMDWTDRHDRFFLRRITQHALLYTEMVTTGALLHGDRERFLAHHPEEQPLALQLGGCEPEALAECSAIAESYGYVEVNLNVGCPSDRVQAARFGACLMAEPELVADCASAMKAATSLPVTVKCRIGIDDMDSYEAFRRFIDIVSDAGVEVFIVHARKAWLSGLSPKQNREIPPLNYDYVYRLKQERPELEIIINGGINTLDDAGKHSGYVDGVMMGRSAYKNPYLLAHVDRRFFADSAPVKSREEIVFEMKEYIDAALDQGTPLKHISRHMLGLFQGQFGGKQWRRVLSEKACKPNAGFDTVLEALEFTRSGMTADAA